MEKLELKHLAPYLPYGLKASFYDLYPEEIIGLNFVEETIEGLEYGNSEITELIKPILRPLSDLTKPMEKGSQKTYFDLFVESDYYLKGMNEVISNYQHLKNQIFWYNRFFEFHFDVFGLIEKGLAIDINTLND